MSSSKERRVAFSQNFLHSRKLVAVLIDRSTISPSDLVIEIGPGKGIITEELAKRSRHVLTIEKDPHHAALMRRKLREFSNVTLFACDALEFPLPQTPYKVFANIPYRITTAIVAKLTSGVSPPLDCWLTCQKEAAEKYAGAGSTTLWSVNLYPWFAVLIEHTFRRRDFTPQPSVESVLMRLRFREQPLISWNERERFQEMTAAIFSAWQPTMAQALRKLLPRDIASITLKQMKGDLSVRSSGADPDRWVELYTVLRNIDDERAWQSLHEASERLRKQQETLDRPTRTRSRRR